MDWGRVRQADGVAAEADTPWMGTHLRSVTGVPPREPGLVLSSGSWVTVLESEMEFPDANLARRPNLGRIGPFGQLQRGIRKGVERGCDRDRGCLPTVEPAGTGWEDRR